MNSDDCLLAQPMRDVYKRQLLRRVTGKQPPWGMLTGVRPVRLVRNLYVSGMSEEQAARHLREDCFVSAEKLDLAMRIEKLQRPILAAVEPRSFSLYISIPFCPSRCSYCSFVSRTTGESAKLIEPYVERLCEDVYKRQMQAVLTRQTVTMWIRLWPPRRKSLCAVRKVWSTASTRSWPM